LRQIVPHRQAANVVASEDDAKYFHDRLPRRAGESAEETPTEPEKDAKPLGDRPYDLPIGDWLADTLHNPLGQQKRAPEGAELERLPDKAELAAGIVSFKLALSRPVPSTAVHGQTEDRRGQQECAGGLGYFLIDHHVVPDDFGLLAAMVAKADFIPDSS